MGDFLRLSLWSGGLGRQAQAGCRKRSFVIRVCCCHVFERNTALPRFVFSLITVKSLQLHGRRQIAEPHKYCLMRVIFFFGVCFLYFFCFSQVRNFVFIPYNTYIKPIHSATTIAPFVFSVGFGIIYSAIISKWGSTEFVSNKIRCTETL